MKPTFVELIALSLMVQVCWIFFRQKKMNRKSLLLQNIPSRKISKVAARQDAWITGNIRAQQTFITPHFNHEVVIYSYSRFHRIVRYETDGNGGERRNESWNLQILESNGAVFTLEDDSGQILIDGATAETLQPLEDSWEDNYYRHTLSYIPATGSVSVIGAVSDSRDRLVGSPTAPVVVSALGRSELLQRLDIGQRVTKYFGLFLFWVCVALGLYSLNQRFQLLNAGESFFYSALVFAVLAALPVGAVFFLTEDRVTSGPRRRL